MQSQPGRKGVATQPGDPFEERGLPIMPEATTSSLAAPAEPTTTTPVRLGNASGSLELPFNIVTVQVNGIGRYKSGFQYFHPAMSL